MLWPQSSIQYDKRYYIYSISAEGKIQCLLEQGRMLNHPELQSVATKHGATPAQVALTWLLQQDGLSIIPKASTSAHVRENHAALALHLTEQDIATLERAFPPPTGPRPLEML